MAFSTILFLFNSTLYRFIHEDFHEAASKIVHLVDKLGIWHRLPVILGLFYLAIHRHLHQEYKLLNVGKSPAGVRFNPGDNPYGTADGRYNDPFNEGAGSQGSFIGRNIMPVAQRDKV